MAGRSSTRILATHGELAAAEAAIEQVLAPYVLRKDMPAADLPEGARGIRMLRHVLPETESEPR